MPDAAEIERRFRDYSSDLLRSDAQDFPQHLKIFMHFIGTEPELTVLTDPLFAAQVNVNDWWDSLTQTRSFELPLDERERLALLLQVMADVDAGRHQVYEFAMILFHDRRFDDMVARFNDKICRPVVRELGMHLRRKLPSPTPAGGTFISTGAGSTNAITVGSGDIEQSVGTSDENLANILGTMRDLIVKDAELSQDAQDELLDDVEILARESRRSTPRSEIVLTVLQALSVIPALYDLAQRAGTLLGHVIR